MIKNLFKHNLCTQSIQIKPSEQTEAIRGDIAKWRDAVYSTLGEQWKKHMRFLDRLEMPTKYEWWVSDQLYAQVRYWTGKREEAEKHFIDCLYACGSTVTYITTVKRFPGVAEFYKAVAMLDIVVPAMRDYHEATLARLTGEDRLHFQDIVEEKESRLEGGDCDV
jgi:hypothetical protein